MKKTVMAPAVSPPESALISCQIERYEVQGDGDDEDLADEDEDEFYFNRLFEGNNSRNSHHSS